jgi:hypothetical protein
MAISGINSAVATVLPTAIKPVLQASASATVGNQNGGNQNGGASTTDAAATNVQAPNAPVDSAQQLNEQIARAQAANEQIVAALLTPPASVLNATGNGNSNGTSANNNRLDIFA